MKPSAGCLIPKTSAEDLYPDSNPGAYIKILGRKFESLAESFRFAAGYLKLRYQTGCSNQPRYFHVFLPRCYATLLFLLHILQLFTQFYSIKHMVTYQFQIIYRLCYSEFFFWVKSGTNAKSLLYFQRTAKNRELILFDIEDMLSSGNWGGKVEQRHCQLLEKKNATFEASNKEIEIASCTVEEQLKIKKIIENTSKRFKRKEVFLYGKYLFCRSPYRNWC